MISFKEYYSLYEEFKDISKEDILYHQTNAYNLYKILESGYLQPRQYRFGSKNLSSLYQERTSPKEIATARKSTFSTIDNLSKEDKAKELRYLSKEVGNVRFELYKKRLQANKYVRGLKVKPIAEFAISERNEIVKILNSYKIENSKKEVEELLQLAKKFDWKRQRENILYLVNKKPYLKKLNKEDFKEFYDSLETAIHYTLKKENEERLVFSGKNETKYKDDFLNDKNDKLYLNPELMKITLLSDFIKEFLNTIAPASYIKYYNKLKSWDILFEKNGEYDLLLSILKKYINNKLSIEDLKKYGLEQSKIDKYEKEYKKEFLPTPEERKRVAQEYTRSGGKKVGRVYTKRYSEEELRKQIEDTKKKVLSKIT